MCSIIKWAYLVYQAKILSHAFFLCRSSQSQYLNEYFYFQQILDYTNYFLNLTEANALDDPKWQVEYSAKVGRIFIMALK